MSVDSTKKPQTTIPAPSSRGALHGEPLRRVERIHHPLGFFSDGTPTSVKDLPNFVGLGPEGLPSHLSALSVQRPTKALPEAGSPVVFQGKVP